MSGSTSRVELLTGLVTRANESKSIAEGGGGMGVGISGGVGGFSKEHPETTRLITRAKIRRRVISPMEISEG